MSNPQDQEAAAEAEDNVQRLVQKKVELESHIQELVERLDEEVENNANIAAARRKLEAELDNAKENLEDLQGQMELVRERRWKHNYTVQDLYKSV